MVLLEINNGMVYVATLRQLMLIRNICEVGDVTLYALQSEKNEYARCKVINVCTYI